MRNETLIEAGRNILRALLSRCTEGEVGLFNKMYGSVDTIDPSKIDWAITQCENTIKKKEIKWEIVNQSEDQRDAIMKGKICPYCYEKSEFVDSAVVYGGVSYGMIYYCKPCDAYCGVHKDNIGTRSLGRLANYELRQAKKEAHHYFDQIWKSGIMKRTEAYKWLSETLGTDKDYTHIGMFSVETCKEVVEVSKKMLRSKGTIEIDFGGDAFDVLNNINKK